MSKQSFEVWINEEIERMERLREDCLNLHAQAKSDANANTKYNAAANAKYWDNQLGDLLRVHGKWLLSIEREFAQTHPANSTIDDAPFTEEQIAYARSIAVCPCCGESAPAFTLDGGGIGR